ncbi:MAG: creatininase family protein [Gemmatimonadaceae bacterium]
MTRPWILAETPWKTVRETAYVVAVLPWGATEAHNLHLPYGTDIIQTERIAAESARLAWEVGCRAVVLPAVPFGVNTTQLDIALTINMNPSTQLAVLRDVVASLSSAGIRRLVLLNGHGGNDFKPIIRELVGMHGVFVCGLDWFRALPAHEYFEEPGDHAGELETSLLMHLVPDLVLPLSEAGTGRARTFRPKALSEGWAWAPREWTKVTGDTGIGDPAAATVAKGERYFTALTQRIASFLVELAAPDDLYEG